MRRTPHINAREGNAEAWGTEVRTLVTQAHEGLERPALLPLAPHPHAARHRRRFCGGGAAQSTDQALSAGVEGTLRLWGLAAGKEVRRFEGHISGISAMAVVPERGQALSAGYDRTARLGKLATGEHLSIFTGDAPFLCCTVTRDARFAIAGTSAVRPMCSRSFSEGRIGIRS